MQNPNSRTARASARPRIEVGLGDLVPPELILAGVGFERFEVGDEIGEFFEGEAEVETVGHEGELAGVAGGDFGFGDGDQLRLGVEEGEGVGGFGFDEACQGFVVGGFDEDLLVAFADGFAWIDDVFDEGVAGELGADGGHVWTDGVAFAGDGVATDAGDTGFVEEEAAAASGIAFGLEREVNVVGDGGDGFFAGV